MIEAYLRMNEPPVIDVDGGLFQIRTYATLRMLINSTDHRLRECYKKYNISKSTETNHNRHQLKYNI